MSQVVKNVTDDLWDVVWKIQLVVVLKIKEFVWGAKALFADELFKCGEDIKDRGFVTIVTLVHNVFDALFVARLVPFSGKFFALLLGFLRSKACFFERFNLNLLLLLQLYHLLLPKFVTLLASQNFPMIEIILMLVLQQLKLKRIVLQEIRLWSFWDLRKIDIKHLVDSLK
jgi:hypothetical protein